MNPLGIMQGRLSPRPAGRPQAFPAATWPDEFTLARECGFDRLEWLVTADSLHENPIWSDAGISAIQKHSTDTGVRVTSVCADCFITRPFVRVGESARTASIDVLNNLIGQCARLNIEVLVIPALEAGEIRTGADATVLQNSLDGPLSLARDCGVRLALESDLPAPAYRELIESMPGLGACYDVGNAAALGYDLGGDLRSLAPQLFGIHLKDRQRTGASVPLGDGDTNFAAVFEGLAAAGYEGVLVLETPAGDDPAESALRNLAFIRGFL